MNAEDMLKQISGMTVLEVSKLVEMMEKEFGVSAAAPVAAVAAAATDESAAVAEQTEFKVTLTSFGDKKINVIKTVREITGLALKEAKELVEGVPSPVVESVSKEKAEELKTKIEEAGGVVEVS